MEEEEEERTAQMSKKHETLYIRTEVKVSSFRCVDEDGKMKEAVRSAEKRLIKEGKPKIKAVEKWGYFDVDDGDRAITMKFIEDKQDAPTGRFHIVEYTLDEPKHVHCKRCDTEWNLRDGKPLKDYFDFDNSNGYIIKCLNCGTTCDTHYNNPESD